MLSTHIALTDRLELARAAKLLRSGSLVAFATETVYGLGADATNDLAVAEIFAVKGRPQFNPLIVHVSDVVMAKSIVQWNEMAELLAQQFWPGPLTLVLKRRPDCKVSLLCSAGGDTIGVRMPATQTARDLIEETGVPIAAPSANRSGRVSPTTAEHVMEELNGKIPLILDGGPCTLGIESTVIDISESVPRLLRPGFVTQEMLEKILGQGLAKPLVSDHLASPGMLESHYAPNLPVRLNVMQPKADEALIAFGEHVPRGAKQVINISERGDVIEAASRLFATLRMLDTKDYSAIAVMPIPMHGLGVAINDRLQRAATR